MTKMESAFEEVVNAYEKLSILLDYRQPTTVDEGTNTENLPYEECSNSELLQEIQDLESEIEELQTRGEELESQKFEYERQIKSLRERIEHEENAKRKLQEELQTINSTNEQRLSTLKVSYEETIDELKKQFDSDLKKLKEDHEAELDEEKNATRLALDAVRRAHDEEIQTLTEKYKQQGFQQQPSCSNVNGAPITDSSRQSRMVEQMSTELTNLTTLYSAKCLENSQLDEKLQSVLANKEDQSALNELDLQNRRLQRELRLKESAIDELKDRIGNLERKLEACGESGRQKGHVAVRSSPSPDTSLALTPLPLAPAQRIRNGQSKMASRRNDIRYHSNPILTSLPTAIRDEKGNITKFLPDNYLDDVKRSLAIPVSERRKFFERVAEYNSPF
uniref:Uncharacterized protein n=1 Tax=Acrobeloides nanus TaxID=290746 RepID=A0A914CPR0_9BILA